MFLCVISSDSVQQFAVIPTSASHGPVVYGTQRPYRLWKLEKSRERHCGFFLTSTPIVCLWSAFVWNYGAVIVWLRKQSRKVV